MRADYSIVRSVKSCPSDECPEQYTPQFYEMQRTAIFIIAVYAIVLPIFFFYLLYREQGNLQDERDTPATRALSFLHAPYKPEFWFFEAIEMGRKLFLVGFVVFFPPGSLLQLVWALNIAISTMAIKVHVRPFRYPVLSYLSLVASLATIFILLMCLVLRTGTLVQELRQTDVVQRSVWKFLEFDLSQNLTIMFSSSILVFATSFYFMVWSMREQKTLPHVRHKSGKPAQLKKLLQRKTRSGEVVDTHQHAFLSHVWVTGQDQVRVIKSLLREVLPGIRIFLDVDDLNDIGKLEEEIVSSQKTLVFVSKGYFESKNCLRELVRALDCEVEDKKHARDGGMLFDAKERNASVKLSRDVTSDHLARMRVVFICESELNKGSLTETQALEELRRFKRKGELKWQNHVKLLKAACHHQERDLPVWEDWPLPVANTPAENARFDWLVKEIGRKFREGAISWHRVKAFQQISLLQIAEHFITPLAGDPAFIPGGPLAEKVKLPNDVPADGFHMYVSPNNAGALDFVYQELRHQFDGQLQIAYSQERIRDFYDAQEQIRKRMMLRRSGGGATSRLHTARAFGTSRYGAEVDKYHKQDGSPRSVDATTPRTPRLRRGMSTSSTISSASSNANDINGIARGKGACVFLLYLDGRTWTSSHSDELKEEVLAQLRAAKQSGVNPAILLVHERDSTSASHFPVEFATFFTTTPNELVTNNLYQPIAIALNEGRHRERSLRDAAQELARLYHNSHLVGGMESRWVMKHRKPPMVGVPPHMSKVGGVRWFGSAHSKKDDEMMRECLNYDLVAGIDDDNDTLVVSPVIIHEGNQAKDRAEPREVQSSRGAFNVHDEGRRLTIIYKPRAQGGRQVRVDGVPRGVLWSRRVEYSLEEKKEILATKGKSKAIDKTHWVEWRPDELKEAVIKRVDEEVGGLVIVERDSRTVGRDGKRSKINYQFDNPERVASRLAVLADALDENVLAGKGVGIRADGSSDRIGEKLAELDVPLSSHPERAGHRSEFASHELATQPNDVTPAVVRDVRNARAFWRDMGSERANARHEREARNEASTTASSGQHESSEGPSATGLGFRVRSRDELLEDAAKRRRTKVFFSGQESTALDAMSTAAVDPMRLSAVHVCFSQRETGSSQITTSPEDEGLETARRARIRDQLRGRSHKGQLRRQMSMGGIDEDETTTRRHTTIIESSPSPVREARAQEDDFNGRFSLWA